MVAITKDDVNAQSTGESIEPAAEPIKSVSIVCSKGTIDMVYPALILANAARMSGIEASIFFTFWGLEAITEKRVDKLQVATVGNPALHFPTMLGGLPGMQRIASRKMKKEMDKLDIPGTREMIEILSDSGCKLYACQLAMEMFQLAESDLVEQVDAVITAMDFFDVAAGSQIIFI